MAAVLRRTPLPTEDGGGDAAADRADAGAAIDSGAADDAQLRRTCLLMPSRATLLAPGTLSLGLLRCAVPAPPTAFAHPRTATLLHLLHLLHVLYSRYTHCTAQAHRPQGAHATRHLRPIPRRASFVCTRSRGRRCGGGRSCARRGRRGRRARAARARAAAALARQGHASATARRRRVHSVRWLAQPLAQRVGPHAPNRVTGWGSYGYSPGPRGRHHAQPWSLAEAPLRLQASLRSACRWGQGTQQPKSVELGVVLAAVTPAEVDALRRRFPVRLPDDGDVGTSADARRYQMAKCPTWWLADGRYVS